MAEAGPEIYGRSFWTAIFYSAANAHSPEKRKAYVAWMNITPAMFPCDLCGEHLAQGLAQYPVEKFAQSPERLVLHAYILKDAANNHYNNDHPDLPRKVSPSWEEVKAFYFPPTQETRPAPATSSVSTSSLANAFTSNTSASGRTQLTINHPAFNQLKNSFQTTTRRRW